MSNKSFLKGAAILGIAGIIVKILGAFFRIPIGNIIGATGFGYYQTAYPIYVMLLTISTAGIPTAISKMVADKNAVGDHYGAHRVFKVSFSLLFVIGIVSTLFMFLGAETIVIYLKSPGAYYSMLSVSSALLFVPIMAAFRGYFQGLQDMTPTAVSQIAEQFARVIVGLGLAILLLDKGLEIAAAGAIFGATAGAIVGTISIVYTYLKRRSKILLEIQRDTIGKQEKDSDVIRKLLSIAIPVTIGAAIMPVMNMIDLTIVMRRLQAVGFTYGEANSLYGQLTGYAAAIINFPQILTVALAVSLVPAISDAYQKRNMTLIRSTIQTGTRIALLIGLPAGIGLITLAKPIMLLLYPMQAESAASAAGSLAILGSGLIFLTLVQTFTAVLQGLGRATVPVINLFIGAFFKVILTYTLTGIPSINVNGAAFGTVVAYAIAALLNFLAVRRLTKTKFSVANFVIKPLIAVGAMGITVLFIYGRLEPLVGGKLATVGTISIGALIYGLMLLATGGITKDDFEMMPGGRKLAKILRMVGLLRK